MFTRKLLAIALGAGMLLGTAAPVMAESRNHCEHRIREAQINLDKAIRRHGVRSRQANERRRQLERARASCGGRYDGFHGRW
jgi:hypothetical protein